MEYSAYPFVVVTDGLQFSFLVARRILIVPYALNNAKACTFDTDFPVFKHFYKILFKRVKFQLSRKQPLQMTLPLGSKEL